MTKKPAGQSRTTVETANVVCGIITKQADSYSSDFSASSSNELIQLSDIPRLITSVSTAAAGSKKLIYREI